MGSRASHEPASGHCEKVAAEAQGSATQERLADQCPRGECTYRAVLTGGGGWPCPVLVECAVCVCVCMCVRACVCVCVCVWCGVGRVECVM